MNTFEELYCSAHQCDLDRFRHTLFWHAMPAMMRPLAFVVGGYSSPMFAADRELISAVGLAHTMDDVREDVRDYFMHSDNRHVVRRVIHLRLSTKRLKDFARQYLPNPGRRETSNPF